MTGPSDTGPSGADASAADGEAAALVALVGVDGIGPATALACHRGDGAPAAWAALTAGRGHTVAALARAFPGSGALDRATAAARRIDPVRELARHRRHGRRVLVLGRPGYPARLVDDPAPPAVLFASGPPDALDTHPTVAVVGTRNATRLGREVAATLGSDLAAAGVAVVSGLALGIDGWAHRGVLDADGPAPGPPVGVVAAGLDLAYPARHEALHQEVAAAGVVLSETPLGRRPLPWRFPARNRIIAGLADAVVVVESRQAGGSMLTVGEALDRGVPVLAVPGHPRAPASAGTNQLLFDGAAVARDATDVLGAIGLDPPAPVPPPGDPRVVPADLRPYLGLLAAGPVSLDEVVQRAAVPVDAAAAALVRLEGAGLVARSGLWFELTAAGAALGQAG